METNKAIAFAIIAVVLILSIASVVSFGDWDAVFNPEPDLAAEARQHERDMRRHGVRYCQSLIRSQLVNPRSAQFRSGTSHARILGDSVLVTSWVDAQNRMGGTVRNGFECLVEWTGGEGRNMQWDLHELHID